MVWLASHAFFHMLALIGCKESACAESAGDQKEFGGLVQSGSSAWNGRTGQESGGGGQWWCVVFADCCLVPLVHWRIVDVIGTRTHDTSCVSCLRVILFCFMNVLAYLTLSNSRQRNLTFTCDL